MRINNNLPALTALTSLNSTNQSLQKTINALSTGLRINSAEDDAAGFAVSEKIRSQVCGLDMALRNTQDGVSLLQTAEGALSQTNSMLQRMRELAVQAANDSLTSQDRQYLQLEIDELKGEIDRIAGTTQFNQKRILDGSSGALWSSSDLGLKALIRGGLEYVDRTGQRVSAEGNYRIDVRVEPGQTQVQKSSVMGKCETSYVAEPEEVMETVRRVRYDTVTEIETQLVETVTTNSELFRIYINGISSDETEAIDNLISLPDNATAESIEAVNTLRAGMSFENGVLTITADGTYNIVGRTSNGATIPTTNRIRVAAGVEANIFLTDVDIDVSAISNTCAFKVESGATANVYLSGTNSLISNGAAAGLEVPHGATLTLSSADGDGRTTGALTAVGGGGAFCGAGIGGPGDRGGYASSGRAGNITINGGTITARGGYYAAGIGGGDSHDRTSDGDGCGTIVINGGNITATGGNCAPGIGHGDGSEPYTVYDDSITINGGTITATSGGYSAGIGGANRVNSGTITISSNATIRASGYMADGASAIGPGINAPAGDNDSVTYTDDDPVLRSRVPDRLYLVEESTIRTEQEVEAARYVPGFTESTRTVEITPPPSLENKTENRSLGKSIGKLSANGLPAGSYTVRTAASPLTSHSYQLTGSYGTDPSGLITLNTGSGTLSANANILFEVTGVNSSAGTVTLKATANLMSTDGTVTKHIVREGLTLNEGNNSSLSGLNLSASALNYAAEEAYPAVTIGLASGAADEFSVGDKFVYNITPSSSARNECTIEVSGTQNPNWTPHWGDNVTYQPVRYSLDASAVTDLDLTFSNFYLSSRDGTVYEGDIVLTTNITPIENGSTLAKFDALRDNPVTTYETADETTRLTEITGLYNPEGVFILDHPQALTITQGNGKSTSIMLYSTDTIGDVRTKLNNAVAYGLGQGQYAQPDKFVSFVTDAQANGLETVPGTFIIRSAIPGQDGELYFSGNQDLLNALGLNTIQPSTESTFTASVYNAHSGTPITSAKAAGPKFVSLILPEIDIEVDSMSALSANWDDTTKRFIMVRKNVYTAFLHIKNNGTIFQTGANGGENFSIQLGDMSASSLGLDGVNLLTSETASRAISTLDRAIHTLSSQREKIGSYTNALEHITTNLTTTAANLTESESRIRDADIAESMMDFVKFQILNQSGTSMLSQANQLPESILTLMQN